MILQTEDIKRYEGEIKIPELGGAEIMGKAKVSLHQPTGVVFIEQKKDFLHDRFIVGVMADAGEIAEKREFTEKTESDFFNAVAYFEELIEKRMPKENEEQPSIGKFYFYKANLKKSAKVKVDGIADEIIIEDFDVPIAFTPPQTKPYGRLDMTKLDKPAYATISSKFALKYNKEASEEEAKKLSANISDVAVYDMTPYANSETPPEGESGEEQPEDVNDKKLSPEDIEGEDLDDAKNKEKDKKKQEKKQSEKKGEKGEKGEEGEGEGEGDEGEESDESKEGGTDNKGKKNKGDKQEQKESEEEMDAADFEELEEGEGEEESEAEPEGEPKKKESEKEHEGKGNGKEKEGEPEEEGEDEVKDNVSSEDVVAGLERMFDAKNGLAEKFRKQSLLINTVKGYSQAELSKEIYKKLSIPSDYPKDKFVELVKEKTNNLYN